MRDGKGFLFPFLIYKNLVNYKLKEQQQFQRLDSLSLYLPQCLRRKIICLLGMSYGLRAGIFQSGGAMCQAEVVPTRCSGRRVETLPAGQE